jgi:glycosyltransferase involved in cell wall biosynthesis
MIPLLRTRLPKVMSYQRHTGGRQIGLAARLGGRTLRFTGCSKYICRLASPAGGVWRPIPNFVEPDKYPFVAGVPADAPLLFLSRVESIKGPDIAIAVARAAGRRLIIAGNRAERGLEREFWDKAVAPHLGKDGIEWVGEVGDARKRDLLAQAAALIVPIRWDEPFGIVFVEALAVGCPVISCPRGAVPEIVEDGRTGVFIRTVEDGVAAVGRLAGLDRAACRKAVVERFSASICAGQYVDLYREMLAPPVAHA